MTILQCAPRSAQSKMRKPFTNKETSRAPRYFASERKRARTAGSSRWLRAVASRVYALTLIDAAADDHVFIFLEIHGLGLHLDGHRVGKFVVLPAFALGLGDL